MKHSYRLTYFVVLPLLFMIGFWFRYRFALGADVTWLLNVTTKLLVGQKYGVDIFETNPPMIALLYFPAVMLHQTFLWKLSFVFTVYVFILKVISIIFVCVFIRKILPEKEQVMTLLLPILFSCCLLFLPLCEFGQRDCLWVVLILPYVFAAVITLQKKETPIWQKIIVGIMAGVGFALKPYFLFTLCLIESYIIFNKRKLFAWIRVESVIILLIFISYLIYIQLYQPGYYQIILPLVSKYYFINVMSSWKFILSNDLSLFLASIMFFYIFFHKYDSYPLLGNVLFLAGLGALLSVITARSFWYYHVYPAIVFMSVLLIYVYIQIFRNGSGTNSQAGTALFSAFFLFLLLFKLASIIYSSNNSNNSFYMAAKKIATYISLSKSPKTIAAFSVYGTIDTSIFADLSDGDYASGIPFFWWREGFVKAQRDGLYPHNQLAHDNKIFENIVIADLLKHKPHWLVVFPRSMHVYENQDHARHQLTYIKELELSEKFRNFFKLYKFKQNISGHLIYEKTV